MPLVRFVALLALLALCATPIGAWERANLVALESIQAEQILAHVEVLASDAYEGRAAGSRGGRAAASYLAKRLEDLGVAPAAAAGADGQAGYYQPFSGGRRNVLAKFPGSDPELSKEWIIVGAHYDHVGYGTNRTSFGPIGYIHNGADDNASGVAALLELVEALANHNVKLRRSILVAFWDGEEIGMLGSQHWARRPTIPLSDVKLAINIDMVGRLREGRLELVGSRTGFGLRQLASVVSDPELWVDFTWELESNSDHWTFIERRIPTLMLHTGLHNNYHRPSDDVETLNIEGIRSVSRYLFDLIGAANETPRLPRFRAAGKSETSMLRQQRERQLPPLPAGTPPPRVGVSWREDPAEPGSVFVTRVAGGSPAEGAGVELYDRFLRINGQPLAGSADFERQLHALLAEDAEEILLTIERQGRMHSIVIRPN